jgi:hypothetical protein
LTASKGNTRLLPGAVGRGQDSEMINVLALQCTGEPFITVPELFLEKKQLIPALQKLFLFLLKPKG